MKLPITILTLLTSLQILGQNTTFYKTKGKKNPHYIEFSNDNVKVYKMGRYFDKGGAGFAILFIDTLVTSKENEFKGNLYTLIKNETFYTLISDKGKKFQTECEKNLNKVNAELNNAYCLKSYIDLSEKLNKEFPLHHYTFRNGFIAWESEPEKSINHNEFIERTDKKITNIYENISNEQIALTKATNFITENVRNANYSILKDSLCLLPIDYRPNNGYFDKSVYQMVKANPEYFYKLLQDFPTAKKFIYYAVERDKALVKQVKNVQGYDELKKEFVKEYNYGKTMHYRTLLTLIVFAGVLTLLIVTQP